MTSTDEARPSHVRLAEFIHSKIEQGHIGDNEALASEAQWADEYEVGRDTVRDAVSLLERFGIVYRHRLHDDIFVEPEAVRRMTRFASTQLQVCQAIGAAAAQATTQRILSIESGRATLATAGALGVRPGQATCRLRRVCLDDRAPIGIEDVLVALRPGMTIEREEFDSAGSPWVLIERKFGASAKVMVEHLCAVAADDEDADFLQVRTGAPLLLNEQLTLSENREPICYCVSKYIAGHRYGTGKVFALDKIGSRH